jgi:hypothetical protein
MTVVPDLFRRAFGWHRPLMLFAAFAAVVALIAAVGLVVDDRTLVGAPIWAKPGKFAFSFGLYAVTWAWLISLQKRHVKLGRRLGTIAAVACTLEVGVVFVQTIRGARSHFNMATSFDATMWAIMGASVLVLWVANLVGAVLVMVEKHADRPVLWSLRLGVLVTLVGMSAAVMMAIGTDDQRAERPMKIIGAHSVGVPDGGPGLPVTNWSTTGGDLRVSHFIGVHGMQAVPICALVLALLMANRARLRDELLRIRLVFVFAGSYTGLMVLTTWQALRGQPLLAPDLVTIGAFSVLAVGTATAVMVALRAAELPAREPVQDEVLV